MSKERKIEHAGDPIIQAMIARKIAEVITGHHPINIAGAIETVLGNMICDYASSYAEADEALTAVHGDIQEFVLAKRFPPEGRN